MKCVYSIKNRKTGWVYIGSTISFYRRIEQHLELLKIGKHFNYKLQAAFKKDGIEHFVAEVLVHCTPDTSRSELYDIEQTYLDSIANKYNIREKARETRKVSCIGIIVHSKHRELVRRDIRFLTNIPGFFITNPKEADNVKAKGGLIIRIVDKFNHNRYAKLSKYPVDDSIQYTGESSMIYKIENVLAKYSII